MHALTQYCLVPHLETAAGLLVVYFVYCLLLGPPQLTALLKQIMPYCFGDDIAASSSNHTWHALVRAMWVPLASIHGRT